MGTATGEAATKQRPTTRRPSERAERAAALYVSPAEEARRVEDSLRTWARGNPEARAVGEALLDPRLRKRGQPLASIATVARHLDMPEDDVRSVRKILTLESTGPLEITRRTQVFGRTFRRREYCSAPNASTSPGWAAFLEAVKGKAPASGGDEYKIWVALAEAHPACRGCGAPLLDPAPRQRHCKGKDGRSWPACRGRSSRRGRTIPSHSH